MTPHSDTQTPRATMNSAVNQIKRKERKIMMNLVKESLHKNLERKTQRANAAEESS
jgi:hypothetical protein